MNATILYKKTGITNPVFDVSEVRTNERGDTLLLFKNGGFSMLTADVPHEVVVQENPNDLLLLPALRDLIQTCEAMSRQGNAFSLLPLRNAKMLVESYK